MSTVTKIAVYVFVCFLLLVVYLSVTDQKKADQEEGPTATRAPLAAPPSAPIAAIPAESEDEKLTWRLLNGKADDDDLRDLIGEANKNRDITFAHLKKNADRYKLRPWRFRGRILEIAESGGDTRARISLDSYGRSVMYVEAKFSTDFVENNFVEVLGLLAGSFDYTSQAGWHITVPAITAAAIEKPGALEKRLGIAPKRARTVAEDDE